MKIAAYLDPRGLPVSLYQPGRMHVFTASGDEPPLAWQALAQHAFMIDDSLSLQAIKAELAHLVEILGSDCRVLLSADIRGLPYSILQEEYSFRTWKSEGPLSEQLNFVREREHEAQARKKYELVLLNNQQTPAPMLTLGGAPGHYWIDLRAALEHPSNPTSRNILIPFLVSGNFVQLEVLCGHLPKWMAWELERLDLAAQSEEIDAIDQGVRVIVYSRFSPEGRLRKPGLLGHSGAAIDSPCSRQRNALPSAHTPLIAPSSRPRQLPNAREA